MQSTLLGTGKPTTWVRKRVYDYAHIPSMNRHVFLSHWKIIYEYNIYLVIYSINVVYKCKCILYYMAA